MNQKKVKNSGNYSAPKVKKKGSDSVIDLICFLRRHKNSTITIVYDPKGIPVVGFFTGKDNRDFVEIPRTNDLLFELGGYHELIKKIESWRFPVSALAEKLASQNFYES